MARAIAARAPGPKYVPAFTVLKLEGEYETTVAKMVPYGQKDRDGRLKHRLEYETVKKPRGYLVSSPKNGSVHISTLEELEALGFTDTEVPLVDEDGEAVGSIPLRIQKAKAKEAVTNA